MAPYVMVNAKKTLKITFDAILSDLTGFSRQKHLRIYGHHQTKNTTLLFFSFSVNISLPDDSVSSIRIPPPPEEFYDLEWHNDEWILPPKELILKMNEVKQQLNRGEISEKEMDILQCKLILEELNSHKLKRRPSEMSTLNEDANPATFVIDN